MIKWVIKQYNSYKKADKRWKEWDRLDKIHSVSEEQLNEIYNINNIDEGWDDNGWEFAWSNALMSEIQQHYHWHPQQLYKNTINRLGWGF